MKEKQVELAIGSLLHDVGKILYRYNDGRNHSESGVDFLKEKGITDENILNQVRFHHKGALKNAQLPANDLAYITYWADNVASGADRREREQAETWGYDKYVPLSSIFNILNGNDENRTYEMECIYDGEKPNNPTDREHAYTTETYSKITDQIIEGLKAIELDEAYVNSLLSVLEATTTFVPSSTYTKQLSDISLYDHSKITAAISGCIYEYVQEQGLENYKETFLEKEKDLYEKEAFLMASMDISGIQKFLYTISSKNALKTLRTKSFYMEIMLEHIVDELLERLGLCRANLIYSGGGHAYLLLPNTEEARSTLEKFDKSMEAWFLENFKTELFVAMGYTPCSANSLMNIQPGSYKEIFQRLGKKISDRKTARYSAETLIKLNNSTASQYERECVTCGALDNLTEDKLCHTCASFVAMANDILEKDFVVILSGKPANNEATAKLPFDRYMILASEAEAKELIPDKSAYIRSYSKNKMFTGFKTATKLWVGDYNNGRTFGDLAESSLGVKRIGVLRADVDNLGQAFVSGFERDGDDRYVGLSRSATFSRKMSIFFKLHLNYLLEHGKYAIGSDALKNGKRKAVIIYSGGDDMFIIGAWNEVLEAAIDIEEALREFTQATLSISAGLGLYPEKYPVHTMADQVGDLEDAAKSQDGKNSISIFDEENTYKWADLKEKVLGEKYALIDKFFSADTEKGASALYKMLSYLRGSKEQINVARLVYMLGRLEPAKDATQEEKDIYVDFAKNMYNWLKKEEDRKELITAIYLYVYLHREKKEESNGTSK